MTLDAQRRALRDKAEADLEVFIRLVHPMRVLGLVHQDLIRWWTRADASDHQLVLLPRDHGKSAMVAYRVAWEIVKNPSIRILYISATSNLAEKQLYFIKGILDSTVVKRYWPELLDPDEGRREKWAANEISVDHPKRKADAIRDPTIFTAGLTTVITGMHCDVAVLDDVVVKDNAYTVEGRSRVIGQYSLLSSIEGAESREWVVGTRYHPKDLYGELESTEVEDYDDLGEMRGHYKLYETFQRQVEDVGDGSGQYLWPRQQRKDGVWFGFNQQILAKKRAKYHDKTQFHAQYYNDPNDPDSAAIKRDLFQYYDKKYLSQSNGYWLFKANRLNVFAAIDFAYTLSRKSDYTAIAVVGIDHQRNYYVLDIARFKTDKMEDYFSEVLRLYVKWGFRKLRAEVTAAQRVIVQSLKERIRMNGLSLSIEDYRPEGRKDERIMGVLEPKYDNHQIWHYADGHCQTLEEELVLQNPAHDDVKDALAACVSFCIPPSGSSSSRASSNEIWKTHSHARFGGIA